MNKDLIRIMNEMADDFLSADAESIKRHASMSIPGLVTFDGEDITENILNRDDFKSFYCKNVGRFGFNQDVLRQYINEIVAENKIDKLKSIFNNVESHNDNQEQAIQSLQYIHSAIRKIISSINDLIPSAPDEKDKNDVEIIRFIIESLNNVFNDNETMFYNSLKVLFPDDVERDKEKQSLLNTCFKESGVILLNLIPRYCRFSMFVMYLYHLSSDYFCGPKDDRNAEEFTNALYQMCLSTFPNILQMNSRTDSNGKKLDEIFNTLNRKTDQLLQGQEKTQRTIDVLGDKSDQKLEMIEDKVNKRNRAERAKPLKLTTCLEAIIEVYEDVHYNYPQRFELHPFAIRKRLSAWNQFLKSEGEKGEPPLPEFSFYRCTTKESFKTWVINTFFPYYQDHMAKKYDALRHAIHQHDY